MPNGDRYTGDFRDDYRDGQGIYVWGDKTPWAGDRYEGEYRRDLRQGWGVYQWAAGIVMKACGKTICAWVPA